MDKPIYLEELIENKIIKTIEELGYELYDVEYIKEGEDNFLRIYIENKKEKSQISLQDCEKVSKNIDDIIEQIDELSDKYFLEVSSSGLEKIIRKDKHLKSNINKKIKITLFKKQEDKKTYIGTLKDFNLSQVIVDLNSKEIIINKDNIKKIQTVYDW